MPKKNNLTIIAPEDIDCGGTQWTAEYIVNSSGNSRFIHINSRSGCDVLVTKFKHSTPWMTWLYYHISIPDWFIAIPGTPRLNETFWIMEKLMRANIPAADAATIAQVLRDMGDF